MKLITTTDPFEMLRHILGGSVGSPRGNCEGCGMSIWSEGGYRVPSLSGIHCSIQCIETVLFGREQCRWCGRKMDKPYSSIDSRLCSRDCSEKYYAQVLGDKTARLGRAVPVVAPLVSGSGVQAAARTGCARGWVLPESAVSEWGRRPDGKPSAHASGRAVLQCRLPARSSKSPNLAKSAFKSPLFVRK